MSDSLKKSITRVYSPGIMQELINKSVLFHNALLQKPKINENIIVDILSSTNNEERQIIRDNYKGIFKYPIQNDINSKISDNNIFREIVLNMFDTPYEYDARELKKAFSGVIDKNENIINELFVTRPKHYLEMIDCAYKNFYEISLREELQNNLSKEYSEFLLCLMDSERASEQTISKKEAYEIVKDLIKNGIKAYASDLNSFKNLFVLKSRKDLILISRAYYELEKKNLYDDILEECFDEKDLNNNKQERKEINKNIRLIKDILFGVITPAQFFAKKCSEVLKDETSDINSLIRILISRAEIDIKVLRDYYYKETKNDIKKDIKNHNNIKKNEILSAILINIFK